MLDSRHTGLAQRRTDSPHAVRSAESLDALVDRFWAHHARYRTPHRPSVRLLGEAALSADADTAARATRLLFARVIEPLCDGFTVLGADTYRHAFAEIVTVARRAQACREFARALRSAGLGSRDALLRPLAPRRLTPADRGAIECVIVLSRLTLGADVAIAMPVLRRLRSLLPDADVCFAGPAVSRAVANGVPGVEHLPVEYGRGATLAQRLNAWPALCAAIHARTHGLAAGRTLLVDTDSRLTQLGLLRPVADECCIHFPSRSYEADSTERLGMLVRRWLDETFGGAPQPLAAFALDARDRAWARRLRGGGAAGRVSAARPAVAVSFGIGADPRKRVGHEFECGIVEMLLRRGCDVWLARGVTAEEAAECRRLCRRLEARGAAVEHRPRDGDFTRRSLGQAVVTFEGPVERFVAAIAEADAYVGYDSAGQHIAAAVGTPVLTVFVEAAGARHAMRWAPYGSGSIEILRTPPGAQADALMRRAEDAIDRLLAGHGPVWRESSGS